MIDNPPIKIYVNKMKNRITFKAEICHYLKLLTPETMKLLASTKAKITKDENGENLPHLEIFEVVLALCNITNNEYPAQFRRIANIYSK